MDAKFQLIREEVVNQADAMENGWLEIPLPEEAKRGKSIMVPRGAFEMWAVARSGGGHLATPWHTVSPPGMKMMNDDPFHTDWMIGAGLPLNALDEDEHGDAAGFLKQAFYTARYAIEVRLLSFKCSVLLPGEFVDGIVVHADRPDANLQTLLDDVGRYNEPPILVIPNAGPDYFDLAVACFDYGGAVIVERGGSMAHLVTAFRDISSGPIVMVPDARKKYPVGAPLYVSTETGEANLHDAFMSRFASNPDPFGNGHRYIRKPEDDPDRFKEDPEGPIL